MNQLRVWGNLKKWREYAKRRVMNPSAGTNIFGAAESPDATDTSASSNAPAFDFISGMDAFTTTRTLVCDLFAALCFMQSAHGQGSKM